MNKYLTFRVKECFMSVLIRLNKDEHIAKLEKKKIT